jgi:hypothetical protein
MAMKTKELRPVMVRIPESLRRRLERVAATNHRSMNTEIIHRLEQSLSIDLEQLLERFSDNERLLDRIDVELQKILPWVKNLVKERDKQ